MIFHHQKEEKRYQRNGLIPGMQTCLILLRSFYPQEQINRRDFQHAFSRIIRNGFKMVKVARENLKTSFYKKNNWHCGYYIDHIKSKGNKGKEFFK